MGLDHRMIAWIMAVFITVSLVNGVPASAASETETGYIVKYKESAAWLMEDDSVPFEVVSEEEMERLKRSDLLEWYEPDGEAILMDSAYYESSQWNLDVINAEGVFAKEFLGQSVRVGVLDSGVNPHEDFGARLLPGHNYIENAADSSETADLFGHGTAVAGLIAGASEHGYIGTAPGAELVPLKVTNGQDVKISAICRAIYGGIDDFDCNVLNLSLGVTGEYESLREAIGYAAEKGVTVVAAVGNDGTSTVYYPAGYDTVIGVGAVNQSETVYTRSNYNSTVFLTAPGSRVRSTTSSGGYSQNNNGTSFAVPQVAGAAAVLLGINPTLPPEQIMDLMAKTATDRGVEGYDEYYGHGILNLSACVAELTGEPVTKPETPTEQDPEPTIEPEPSPEPEPEPSYDPQPKPTTDPQPRPSPDPQPDPSPDPIPEPEMKIGYIDCPGDNTCVMASYSDLDPNSWYHDGVHYALENRIMNGVSDQMFAPSSSTSRAMIVTMLWRMEGEPVVNDTTRFADVPSDTWYTEAVRWAASERIVDGYSAERFAPNDNVSREQLATILWRYAKYKGTDKISASKINLGIYIDAEHISRWAYDGMQWAVNAGLITGAGNDKLSPETDASRAQVATMLMRYGKIIK